MPELPEVETVRSGLLALIGKKSCIDHVDLRERRLRYPVSRGFAKRMAGLPIIDIERRAKYLLFRCGEWTMINHLGMTGSWRLETGAGFETANLRKHDHCLVHLADKRCLIYNDPRRFGMIDVYKGSGLEHIRLEALGPEPLDIAGFNLDYLLPICRKRKASIKQVIMDQAVVVGVGNIYASESLHLAGINPKRSALKVSKPKLDALVTAIRQILDTAIRAGGSTISDFKQAGGSSGYFQHQFKVYERSGQPCHHCGSLIKQVTLGQRSSFYCPRCQK